MAHFLGAGGATEFLKALDTKGNTVAAKLLPDALPPIRAFLRRFRPRQDRRRDLSDSRDEDRERRERFRRNAPATPSSSSFAVAA